MFYIFLGLFISTCIFLLFLYSTKPSTAARSCKRTVTHSTENQSKKQKLAEYLAVSDPENRKVGSEGDVREESEPGNHDNQVQACCSPIITLVGEEPRQPDSAESNGQFSETLSHLGFLREIA